MEQILRALPPKPRSILLRYALTTLFVALCLLAVIGLKTFSGTSGWYLMLLAVVIASVLFDHGAGIYAGVLSTILLGLTTSAPGTLLPPAGIIIALVIFLVIAVGFAFISESLRTGLERAEAAERAKDLLLQELGHRTKNNLMMAISVLSIQARLKSNPETKAALEKAIARIHAIAGAHEHFSPSIQNGRVEMREYLESLCDYLGESLRDVRPIAVRLIADEVYLRTEKAVPIGLIVNELVTNALKHAFPGERDGTVLVTLKNDPPSLHLVVQDNGVGCAQSREERIGSRLTRLFAQQLDATMNWEDASPGCRVHFILPANY